MLHDSHSLQNRGVGILRHQNILPTRLQARSQRRSQRDQPQLRIARLDILRGLRDIFGNPYQFAAKNGCGLQKSNAVAIAKSIYDERSFSRIPEIAEVLSSEGFDGSDIVTHCRQQVDHVRGCWVIDLLLGKH